MSAKHEIVTQNIEQDQNERFSFDVFGLWCSTCSRSLEESIKKISGVVSAAVHFGNSQASIVTNGNVSKESLEACAAALGYSFLPALSSESDKDFKNTKNQYLVRLALVSFSSMWSIAFSLAYYAGEGTAFIYLSSAIAIPGILFGIVPFFKASVVSLKSRMLSFDILLVLANLSLFIVSLINLSLKKSPVFFDSIVMTLSIVLWARFLEVIFRFSVRSGLISSLSGTLSSVYVLIKDQWVESPAQKIRVGRIVRFEKNKVISLDGILESDFGLFDLSFVSGESSLAKLTKGALVRAGSKLISEVIEIRVTAPVGQRWIDSLYFESVSSKAQTDSSSRFEKMLEYWIPTVLILSFFVGFALFFITRDPLQAISVFASTLLVTCPCSLILAEPLSRLWLKKVLASKNIQINNDHFPTNLKNLSVVFDKTGTLISKDEFKTKLTPLDNSSVEHCNELIRSCCYENHHPTTFEIFQNYDLSKLDTSGTRCFTPGAGITWTKSNRDIVRFGKSSWISEDKTLQKYQSLLEVKSQVKAGLSIVSNGMTTRLESLRKLNHLGYQLGVLTGDRIENCSLLEKSQIFDFIVSNCSPEEKRSKIRELKSHGRTVVYVGDGINDILAMNESDFSISVRTEIVATQSTSSLVISGAQIENLDWIFEQFKIAGLKKARSLKIGLVYNTIMIPLALFGMLHPLLAVFAMTASSLLITTNSLYTKNQNKLIRPVAADLKSVHGLIQT